jgi:hypothetical protein
VCNTAKRLDQDASELGAEEVARMLLEVADTGVGLNEELGRVKNDGQTGRLVVWVGVEGRLEEEAERVVEEAEQTAVESMVLVMLAEKGVKAQMQSVASLTALAEGSWEELSAEGIAIHLVDCEACEGIDVSHSQ